jgi:hypothetical protein
VRCSGVICSFELEIPFEIVPLSASQTGRCEAVAPETREALSSPILICMSRPLKAASCLTASRCGRLLLQTRGAESLAGDVGMPRGVVGGFRGLRFRGGGAKMPFVSPIHIHLLGQTLSAYGLVLTELIRGCAMVMLGLVVQQGQELWSRWLSDRGAQCRRIFSWCPRVNDGLEPSMSRASSPHIVAQSHLRLMEQQRRPPVDMRHLECRLSYHDHPIGRGVSALHQVVVSKVEDSGDPGVGFQSIYGLLC